MMKCILSLVLLLALSLSVGSVYAEPEPFDYRVGNGDVLKISVYDNPDLETVARIGTQGHIQFPLIGQVDISGLNVAGVAKKIETALADGYLVDPQVSVFIQEYRSKKVVIMGQVNKPGVLDLSGPTNLLELISMAGGLREDAANSLTITRARTPADSQQQVVNIDLQRLLETGDADLNVPILDQDNIFVPKAGLIYVIGEVAKPAAYKYQEGATVLKIISMAGDFAEFASKKKIRIIRTVEGKETVLEKVSLQEPVFPGDLIEVPESLF